MVTRLHRMAVDEDPRALLGVSPAADDDTIRRAYLEKIKAHPPDAEPEAFEKIRDAYELLRDPRRRAALVILAPDHQGRFTELLDGDRPRRHVGPGPWLDLIRKGSADG